MVPSLDAPDEWIPSKSRTNHQVDLEIYQTGEYADCNLVCEGRAWDLHRQIICPRSAYFRDAYKGNLDEQGGLPSIVLHVKSELEGYDILTIKGFSVEEVEIALIYLYAEQYPRALLNSSVWECYRIFLVAEYMQIEGLRDVALEALVRAFTRLECRLRAVMAEKLVAPGGPEGEISDGLLKVFPPKTMEEIDTILMRGFAPPLPGLRSLLEPVLDFLDSTISIIWGVRRPAASPLAVAMSENKLLWFAFMRHMLDGKSMDQAAEAVVEMQRVRREQQSKPPVERKRKARRKRKCRAQRRQMEARV